jgi:uncharacterized membrane protein YbhN (UPF0104 family)
MYKFIEKSHDHTQDQNSEQVIESKESSKRLGLEGKELWRARPIWRKISSFAIRIVVSLALVLWILKAVDLTVLNEVVGSPKLVPILAMIGFSLVFVFLGGVKLWVLFRGFSPITLWLFTGYFFLAGSVGSLAPAILGDFTLVGLAQRSKISIHEGLSALLMDRLITLMTSLFIFTPFTLVFVLPLRGLYVLMLTVISAILFGGLIWIALRLAPTLFDHFSITKRFWESFSIHFTRNRTNLYSNIFISSLRGIVSGIALIFALMAAHLSPPFFPTLCITNSLSIITYVPVSLSGLGIYEGGGLILLESIGLNREQVVAGLFYQRLYIILSSLVTLTVWGIIIVIKRFQKRSWAFPGAPFSSRKTMDRLK